MDGQLLFSCVLFAIEAASSHGGWSAGVFLCSICHRGCQFLWCMVCWYFLVFYLPSRLPVLVVDGQLVFSCVLFAIKAASSCGEWSAGIFLCSICHQVCQFSWWMVCGCFLMFYLASRLPVLVVDGLWVFSYVLFAIEAASSCGGWSEGVFLCSICHQGYQFSWWMVCGCFLMFYLPSRLPVLVVDGLRVFSYVLFAIEAAILVVDGLRVFSYVLFAIEAASSRGGWSTGVFLCSIDKLFLST